MRILYLEITPEGHKSSNGYSILKMLMPEAEIVIPELPEDPMDALSVLKLKANKINPDLAIGVGLGGTMVQHLYGTYRILVNPIYTLSRNIGTLSIRLPNGEKKHTLFSPQQQAVMSLLLKKQFIYTPYGEEQYIYGLFAAKNDYLRYCETFFKQHFKYNFHYEGEEAMTEEDWAENVMPIVRIMEQQKTHEKKKILYIDLDGTLVDYESGKETLTADERSQYGEDAYKVPGYFSRLKPKAKAIESFKMLSKKFDVYILSTAPWSNPTSWSDKARWVKKHLGIYGYKRLILTHRKDLNIGDYLIDDRPHNGAAQFSGVWLQFGKAPLDNWEKATEYMLSVGKKQCNGDRTFCNIKNYNDERPILYVDMDSVLVNFADGIENKISEEEREKYKDHYDDVPDFFARLEPIEHAVEAFNKLSEEYNTFLLSTAPWDNDLAWTHKMEWVMKYLGAKAKKRLILSHHKNLNRGCILIDDSSRNGVKEFGGKWFQFGKPPYENWEKMLAVLNMKLDKTGTADKER